MQAVQQRLKAGGRAFAHIAQYHPELTAFRRDLHAHPELGFEEVYTSARVREALRHAGVDEVHEGIGRTGVVGIIHGQGRSSGSMIGLRADMDALPMAEHNDFAWKSCKSGLMHGCGHDGHTAMLVGAARYLAATRHFDGTAVLIFQPGEEGLGGARVMIEDGLFERFPVQSVYAMHNWPAMRPGTVGINSGAMMAAADRVTIEVTGRGGHGAHAYQTVDVVLVAAHIVTAVQGIVSRNVRPLESAVISLCAVQAGDLGAFSVLPGTATLVGTVRTFDPAVQEMVERRIKELCNAIALGFGATATVRYERIYPATINTESDARFAGDVAASLVGEENVDRDLEPSMGAEDFSFMLQARPGAYLRLGQGMGAGNSTLHNSRYDFNDDVLPLGAALHAGLVEQAMPLGQAQ
ncbi:MAG: M20 aminoacylase family protein [Diaphorobacter nitroreducens]|jgi:hippurate hydrolase|uniref:M20 aminoacylase family protein n=1 Tax=Diaphorobacter TaxID=238749 RepID=UPI000B59F503|nr:MULTISPECIES: M20 aminoacylase family protein [Diaphorobacter]MDU7587089.1 M20 aminoacylase family protein [Acidovorax sp.]UOB05075.1 M20 family metallopeptidase [Diaphorobacter sp. LI3]ASI69085.1 amidohydrolase [Diaphorobacter nitroreducens]PZU39996.1 MAG: amidohydrolase [Acidovorax sp.]QJY32358.1 amidohydrolase [Diaphorobacter sp. JS3050]